MDEYMRIDHLHIENFKKFASQDFDFHPKFTLLAGDNGAGKTTVLDALAVAAGVWLVEAPDSTLSNSGRIILPAEARLEPQDRGDRIQFNERKPVIVSAKGRIGNHEDVRWTRQIRVGGKRTTNAEAGQAIEYVKDIYACDGAGERLLCPVLAYYGAGRAWLPSNKRIPKEAKSNGPARRWAAFYDCFNERIRVPELHKWFLGETLAAVNRSGRMRPGFEVVKRAILRCLPKASKVWYDTDLEQIVLTLDGNSQPFGNLSAGEGMMLALIADLAIKAVTQNAFLLPPDVLGSEDEPLPKVLRETPGVVLIDELDVHLHPIWQRRVATDLKATFPSIQFVCTSHSPQVIGEVKPEEVRLLGRDGVQKAERSTGLDSNWILRHLMEADERNPGIKLRLESIEKEIAGGNYDEARDSLQKLRDEGWDFPELAVLGTRLDKLEALAK
jgi:predicted ATP-binding protein involved in virulence